MGCSCSRICETEDTIDTIRNIKVNGRDYKVKKLLGEGGFSYVFLVTRDGQPAALKLILAQSEEQVKEGMWEIEVLRQINHPNAMKLIEYEIGPSVMVPKAQEIRLILPYYKHGTLQNLLESRRRKGAMLLEGDIYKTFLQICDAVSHFHSNGLCHRDVKPHNVMLDDAGNAVLVDFGSASPSRIVVKNRMQALTVQERAATITSAPYRAPELFDVHSNCVLDERVDVWALGCTLYAMGLYENPFEYAVNSKGGGSLAIAILSPPVFPENHPYSPEFCDLIRFMLNPDPQARPHLQQVMHRVAAAMLHKPTSSHPSHLCLDAPSPNRI